MLVPSFLTSRRRVLKKRAATRQAILNDDLGQFTTVPAHMGRAARRTIGNLVFDELVNGTAPDGKATFHADHNNLRKTGTAISTDSLEEMDTVMSMQQLDDSGPLNISAAYLLVPVVKKHKARTIVAAEFHSERGDQHLPNSMRNAVEVIADARLDKSSKTAWYGVADPNRADTIEVDYLDGNDQPYLETQNGWTVDGTEIKVRIDAGVGTLDYRGLYKNPGK